MPVHAGLRALAARDLDAGAPFAFEEFERRSARVIARANRRRRAAFAAAVAGIAFAAVVAVLGVRVRGGDLAQPPPSPRAGPEERWLAAVPPEPVVVSAATYASIAALEDRIAWIEDRLNDSRVIGGVPLETAALDGERARLVRTLASVRYADALAARFN